ncbi:MAG: IS256 family transposase [Bacteroidota bacterium]|nr:IS256 family transposase [Bacteroidota bacterium]
MNLDISNNARYREMLEELCGQRPDEFNLMLEKLLNIVAVIEREKYIGAGHYERSESRTCHANGFKDKTLLTRTGPLSLKVPQVRDGDFYPSSFEKGMRSERALKLSLGEMYVQGVSTRKVKAITEELCGTEISSSTVSRAAKLLDDDLDQFRNRALGRYKFIFLDAHYEKVRHTGSVQGLACLKAVGVTHDGHREIIGVSVSLSEAEVHWRTFLEGLQKRGLSGVELFISDDHTGLKAAKQSVYPSVPWQRCTFHLAQNAQAYVPKKNMREEIAETVRDIFSCSSKSKAQEKAQEVAEEYSKKAPEFSKWLEENIEEGMTFYSFPKVAWKKIRTVNVVERLHSEIRRRTRVVRIFPNTESCLRLVTAVLQEFHESWVGSGRRFINLEKE